MIKYKAKNITELTNAIIDITRRYGDSRVWWRGQASIDWDLSTSLYRKRLKRNETDRNSLFKLMARSRYSDCPRRDDIFPWLFLMQHYRLPTRLLDWSDSPLIALYFAIESAAYDDVDAALWALSPTGLNFQQSQKRKIYMPESREVQQLGFEAFNSYTSNPDKRILAIFTEQFDVRHMVQQSVFTIHGSDIPINHLQESHNFIAGIQIPKEAKPAFRQILNLLGISRHAIFPDLENLAMELSSLEFVDEIIEATQSTGTLHSGNITKD